VAVNFGKPEVWMVLGTVVLAIALWLLPRFSKEARYERRRRKNSRKVVSTAHRPIVKLSARTKDSKKKK
jgi:hypothetical protein